MPADGRSMSSYRLSSMNRMASVKSAFGEEMAHHAEAAMHAPDHVEEEKTGCGPMKNYPLLSVVCFAALGLCIGIGLSFWEPDNADSKEKALKWIGLVGDLFIRALKCVILPLGKFSQHLSFFHFVVALCSVTNDEAFFYCRF